MTDARRPPFVIAIDGPAASGKSSTAQWVARRLGYRHVDSGALYRAATAARLGHLGEPEQWTEDDVLASARGVEFVPLGESFAVVIDAEPADDRLRDAQVTQHVSRVAQMQRVRQWVNELVRRAAAGHDVVVDGRDMGTVVFPSANLKIFLIADPWERSSAAAGPTPWPRSDRRRDRRRDEPHCPARRAGRDAVGPGGGCRADRYDLPHPGGPGRSHRGAGARGGGAGVVAILQAVCGVAV